MYFRVCLRPTLSHRSDLENSIPQGIVLNVTVLATAIIDISDKVPVMSTGSK